MGQFGKMEGLVYENIPIIKAFALPAGTRYFAGVDWGYTNPFVISIRALTPEGNHYRIGEYYKSGLTIDEIIPVCQSRMQLFDIELFICDPSNPAYIESLNRAGCPATKGINLIRYGIDKQTELIRTEKFAIFEDENPLGIDEYNTYHYPEPKDYKVDEDAKEPEPVKSHDHGIDADRYATMYLVNITPEYSAKVPQTRDQIPKDQLDRLRWLKRGGSSRNK